MNWANRNTRVWDALNIGVPSSATAVDVADVVSTGPRDWLWLCVNRGRTWGVPRAVNQAVNQTVYRTVRALGRGREESL